MFDGMSVVTSSTTSWTNILPKNRAYDFATAVFKHMRNVEIALFAILFTQNTILVVNSGIIWIKDGFL
jgi:hypothetical protein